MQSQQQQPQPQPQPPMHFFDDDLQKNPFEFSPVDPKYQKDLDLPPLLMANLLCKNLTLNLSIEGQFALHNGLLAFYPNGYSSTAEAVLDLNYSRLKCSTSNAGENPHSVVVSRNNASFELRFTEKSLVETWNNALRKVCIMTNFHDEYKATKMIGRGSFAKVYLVDAKTDGKRYAVKAFAKESVGTPNKANPRLTMINEINLMRTVDHDNIIKLYEVHETERSIYIVMELVEGRPLQELLSKRTLKKEYSLKKIIEMFLSILDALAYIASKGIMHRDLKPDNILVDNTGKLKIVDFGLGTVINVSEYIFKKCGTPGYIAPEVFRFDPKIPGTAYNDRCDVFSAGCILYYLLVGRPFFHGTGASEILKLNKEFTEFDVHHTLKKELANPNSSIGKDGIDLLMQMLEYDQKKRISAAQALNHCYFNEIYSTVTKDFSSRELFSKELPSDSPRNNRSGTSSMTSVKNADDKLPSSLKNDLSERASPLSPSRNRFTIKESMYLDVGKPDFTGKIESISNGSSNNSLYIKGDNFSSNNNSVSSFARQTTLSEQKSKGQSRSFKGHNINTHNHNFLKAAIFNNMKNGELGLDSPNTPKTSNQFGFGASSNASNGTEESGSSGEIDDVGDEKNQIQQDFDRINEGNSPKYPSQMLHSKMRSSRSVLKK